MPGTFVALQAGIFLCVIGRTQITAACEAVVRKIRTSCHVADHVKTDDHTLMLNSSSFYPA